MKLFNNNDDIYDVKVVALGGLGEVGKNMYVIMYNSELVIIDSGVMFGDEYLPGVDYVLPDYTYLIENKDKADTKIMAFWYNSNV